jgi:hypothetical protein
MLCRFPSEPLERGDADGASLANKLVCLFGISVARSPRGLIPSESELWARGCGFSSSELPTLPFRKRAAADSLRDERDSLLDAGESAGAIRCNTSCGTTFSSVSSKLARSICNKCEWRRRMQLCNCVSDGWTATFLQFIQAAVRDPSLVDCVMKFSLPHLRYVCKPSV